MSAIHKLPNGCHIDLSKILHVTPAQFVNRMGIGGFFFEYAITFQLKDSPIIVSYPLTSFSAYPSFDGEYGGSEHEGWCIEHVLPLVRKEVDDLIAAWGAIRHVGD